MFCDGPPPPALSSIALISQFCDKRELSWCTCSRSVAALAQASKHDTIRLAKSEQAQRQFVALLVLPLCLLC